MTTQNLNLGALDKLLNRISTPEGLEATAQELSITAPPDVNALGQQAGAMQSLEDTIRQRIAPTGSGTFNPQQAASLGQALMQSGNPPMPQQVMPAQIPPAQVPGQFILQPPAPVAQPQMSLANALRGL